LSRNFVFFNLIALVSGYAAGYACNVYLDSKAACDIADLFSLVSEAFHYLITMVIAPLVLITLIVGISYIKSRKELRRIGLKTIGWFVSVAGVAGARPPDGQPAAARREPQPAARRPVVHRAAAQR
jgi:Na+/H+-dicarboxylate symporter